MIVRYCINVLVCGNEAEQGKNYCRSCQREQSQAWRQSDDRTEQIYNRLTTKPGRELPKRKEHK